MRQEELFAIAIGIVTPWEITSIHLDTEKGELNINVDFIKGSEFEYISEETGEISRHKAYDTSIKKWRHMNFFQYRCYLHARVPRVRLDDGSIKQVRTPWEGNSAGFTLLFEAFIIQLAKSMTVHQVCQTIGSYDSKIWNILHCYTEKCREESDYSAVKEVGVDETAARRGHDYVTLFVDLQEKKTIFVTEGKSNETIVEFVKDLGDHNRAAENIESVSCDMSPAFIKGIKENLSDAEIVFDKFHIIKIINDAVDEVRREEAKTNPLLKNSRYVFLKNQSNFTKTQKEKYDEIRLSKLNIKTLRAMQIREAFQQIYSASGEIEFEKLLKKWYFWATHCRIPQIIKVAKTIKEHWEGVVNWAKKNINNGILEGLNSLFQAAKAKARGYKKTKTIKAVIYILTGKLEFLFD
ncbi:MAG: ISL3 family transposase [Candidatus Delongbacteria bacterium]|nr:ISL3 family transposase [Candidatus Delongbacteria bacterium]